MLSRHFYAAFILVYLILGIHETAQAQTYSDIYTFAGGTTGGMWPYSGVSQGTDGNFYSTTWEGGTYNDGTAYKVTPSGTLTLLHSFGGSGDGTDVYAGVIQATNGYFYGTTYSGNGDAQNGIIYSISPTGTYSILHYFNDGSVMNDGIDPYGGLIQGSDGNLYGTTCYGGQFGQGTVFKITTAGVVTILHSFNELDTTDGALPNGSLIQDSSGSFYGATRNGGVHDQGTVFKLTSSGIFSLLWSFGGTGDGQEPYAGVTRDNSGNLYGTTLHGGAGSTGIVFKVTSTASETILHSFEDGTYPNDGGSPYAGLLLASNGNLYGTCLGGGSSNPASGVIFTITTGGSFYSVLHEFGTGSGDANPMAGLIELSDGLYGTASGGGMTGGNPGVGTIFKYAPAQAAQTISFTLSNMPYTPNPITLNGVATSGLPVYYTKSGPANISGNVMTLTGVGSLSVRAHQDGNAFYAAAATVLQVVNITQASQTISFAAIPNQTYPCPPIALNATASSGLAVYYTHSGPVSISGNTATVTGTGAVGIRAHQDGNANYTAAPTVLQNFTVN